MHSPLTLCEEGGRGEMGGRETEERGGRRQNKKEKKRKKKDKGRRKKKGEERSGGWRDSRVHVKTSCHDGVVSPHTSHLF